MKIIGIGLNRTGTSTLGAIGERLGLRVKSWDPSLFEETIIRRRREALWPVIETYDLFNDFPYPLVYDEIDARYPGAKFILTRRRAPEDWLGSVKAHAMRMNPASITHKTVYGFQYPHGRERVFLDYYLRHNDKARAYFADRPGDFLEICWEEENDWSRLAAFLGVAAPDGPPPKTNVAAAKSVNPLRYLRNLAQKLAQDLRGP